MPDTPIEAALDALLQVIVKGDLERRHALTPKATHGDSRSWHDAMMIPHYGELDLPSLTMDPISTACRAELRRIGNAIHAAGGSDAPGVAMVSVVQINLTNANWRTIVMESVWAGVGGQAS